MRSSEARRKANLPPEAVQIPNYRQLLLTKQFSNYSRCTCDHSKHEVAETGCGKHKKKSVSSSSGSSSSSSGSSSGSDSSGTSSGSSSDSGSSRSSSGSEGGLNSSRGSRKKRLTKKKRSAKPEDEFEDIKSMEINRKMNHPERLHKDLCFNEPDQVRLIINIFTVQIFDWKVYMTKYDFLNIYIKKMFLFSFKIISKTNDGPLCKCKLKSTTFGTRHQIYYGEQVVIQT